MSHDTTSHNTRFSNDSAVTSIIRGLWLWWVMTLMSHDARFSNEFSVVTPSKTYRWVGSQIHMCHVQLMGESSHSLLSWYSLLHLECHLTSISYLNLLGLFSTERGKRDLENQIIDWDWRSKKWHSKCNRLYKIFKPILHCDSPKEIQMSQISNTHVSNLWVGESSHTHFKPLTHP